MSQPDKKYDLFNIIPAALRDSNFTSRLGCRAEGDPTVREHLEAAMSALDWCKRMGWLAVGFNLATLASNAVGENPVATYVSAGLAGVATATSVVWAAVGADNLASATNHSLGAQPLNSATPPGPGQIL